MNFRSFICSAVVISVFALSASALEVSLGVKGGLNLSRLYGGEKVTDEFSGESYDPYEYQKPKSGMAIGVALQLKLADMFAIEPEVLFSQKGQKFKIDEMGMTAVSVQKINYIEIPVLFQILIPAGDVFTPMVYVGPSFGIKAGKPDGYDEFEGQKEEWTSDDRKSADESMSGFDFGLAFGVGAGIKAGPGSVVLDIGYSLGFLKLAKLSDEMKDAGFTESNLPKDKNSGFLFRLGYLFSL